VRNLIRAALLAAACVVVGAGCGLSGGSDDPATSGPRSQAVERLHDYGLPVAEARCIVDRMGAQTVVETSSIDALVAGAPYRAAEQACAHAR
jgi:hypothetical protein